MSTSIEQYLEHCQRQLPSVPAFQAVGELTVAQGMLTASLPASVGELVQIEVEHGQPCLAEVIGFSGRLIRLMSFHRDVPLKHGNRVRALGRPMKIPVGEGMMGRVINALGEPVDGKGPIQFESQQSVQLQAPDALTRNPVDQVFTTGQRAIDGMLTLGKGQRVGLFAGSGVGKSTLLGQIARYAEADLNVVALIGERGREVRPFIEESLGPDGMAKSIVIVSTANETPLARVRAAESSIAVANWFRQRGRNVFLMVDSLTRFAMAQRDLGLLLGEPPTSRGYTPSVFQKMAVLLEQLGNSDRGSITGLLTVLVDGDDMNDPVADSARSILDGHIVLDRKLANAGHYPPISLLQSSSRLFHDLADPEHAQHALAIRRLIARYEEVIDLVQVGAYTRGLSRETDLAIDLYPQISQFLQQGLQQPSDLAATRQFMQQLANLATPNGSQSA